MNTDKFRQCNILREMDVLDDPLVLPKIAASSTHRRERAQRVAWAWGTSVPSKLATIAVQVLALPLVYHTLGEAGYAAYAAVTALASLIGVFNLGIGGSLVTPIAEAATAEDEGRQALLVQAGLGPLVLMSLVGTLAVIPMVAFLPLRTLFGRIGATAPLDLRIAALIAALATLTSLPLSAVGFLRQAYQEMHVSNLIGAAFNVVLCVSLLVAAAHSAIITVFVAISVLIPLSGNVVNLAWLFAKRRFLLQKQQSQIIWDSSRHLLADGIHFLGASFATALVYQWPVYWIARILPASSSSSFAICIQAIVLPLGFIYGFLQPLWSSVADALSRADHAWLNLHFKRGRFVVVTVGISAFLIFAFFGERLIQLWLRRPFKLNSSILELMGAYIMLSLWETYHFVIALGFGRLRPATAAIFQRSIGFAIAIPLLTKIGGVAAVWCGLCCSILFWTAWRLPRVVHIAFVEEMGTSRV